MTLDGVVFSLKHDLKYLRPRIALWLFNFIPDFYSLSFIRNYILRLGGAKVPGRHAYIRSPLYCSDLRGIEICEGVFVNSGCRFQGTSPIYIGANSQIGPQCCFETVDHLPSGDILDRPIYIAEHTWLGAKVIVVGGKNIGAGATIAAGAVVTKNIPANTTWGGVPAREIISSKKDALKNQ